MHRLSTTKTFRLLKNREPVAVVPTMLHDTHLQKPQRQQYCLYLWRHHSHTRSTWRCWNLFVLCNTASDTKTVFPISYTSPERSGLFLAWSERISQALGQKLQVIFGNANVDSTFLIPLIMWSTEWPNDLSPIRNLSYDRSIASSKARSQQGAI